MLQKRLGLGLFAWFACGGLAGAAPVAPATLAPGFSVSYFAPNSANAAAFDGAWLVFRMDAPGVVDIDINRRTAPTDLIAAVFAGDVTGIDVAAVQAGESVIDDLFVGDGVVGGLSVVDLQDDTEEDLLGGPFGDPRFNLNLNTGVYSLFVASLQPTEGGEFTITASGMSPLVRPAAITGGLQGPFFAAGNSVPASGGSWFRFTLPERANVELDLTRTTAGIDPAASLFRGDVTGVNASVSTPGTTVFNVFVAQTIGPLTEGIFEDDTDEDPFNGPFGDPRFTIDRMEAGTYSMLVGTLDPQTGGTVTIDSFRIRATPLSLGTVSDRFAMSIEGPAAGTSWFTFSLATPRMVDIDINRLSAATDLFATLCTGNANGVSTTINESLASIAFPGLTLGPLTASIYEDDTEPDTLNGPFGDPRFLVTLPPGDYSLAVGTLPNSSTFPTRDGDFSLTFSVQCNEADLAAALGTLDINDILTFAGLFNAQEPGADFFADGVFDINDILVFAGAFNAGCP